MPSAYRYSQLADLVIKMIDDGALLPGDRLPSVRSFSQQHKVSVFTTLRAYRLLEDQGAVVAKPQSGFYVPERRSGSLALPSKPAASIRISTVSIGDGVAGLLQHAANPALVPLGCTLPDAAVLKSARLDAALARIARRDGQRLNIYSPAEGERALRQEIAKRSMRSGRYVSADNILVTNGCTEAITIALSTVAKAGDTIAVESPTYFGLLHTLQVLGMKALELPTHPQYGVDAEALAEALATRNVKACVFSSTFSNPLGSTISESKKRLILQILKSHAVPLIEDDAYGEIYFGRDKPKPFIALDGGDSTTIYCGSFSKSLAPGYRVGWIEAGSHYKALADRKLAFSLCNPMLPQAALAEFLHSGAYDSHLRRIRRVFEANIRSMIRVIQTSFPAVTRVSRPAGGFVVWVELPRRFDSRLLFEEALQQGICLAPGHLFSPARRYKNCMRLSASFTWDGRVEAAIHTLGNLVARQLSGSSLPRA